MTHQKDYNLSAEMVEEILRNGLDVIPEMVRVLLNSVMQAERCRYLQAGEYKRSADRKGHANGYKPKTVRTRMGEITFAIPQVREGGFYPSTLEKGLRSERALTMTFAEMYVQGVSTRKVKAITETLCDFEISAAQVSRATAQLDATCRNGGNGRWVKSPISILMLGTRRYGSRSGAGCSCFGGFWHHATG